MVYTFRYQLSPEEFAEFNVYAVWSSPEKKQFRLKTYVSTLIFVLIGVFAGLYLTNSSSKSLPIHVKWVMAAIVAIVLSIIFQLTVGPRTKRKAIRIIQQEENSNILSETVLEFGEDQIRHKDSSSETIQSYSTISKVANTATAIYLFINSMQGYIVPKRIFASIDEEQGFMQFLTQKISVTSSLRSINA